MSMPFWNKIRGVTEPTFAETIRELSAIKLKQYPKYRLQGSFLAQVVKVYDGDTITIVFRTGFDQPYFEYSVRMFGYDSPELKPLKDKDYTNSRFTSREDEIEQAKSARDYLANMILEKPVIAEVIPDDDKYGRLLCRIFACATTDDPVSFDDFTLNISDTMISAGHGYSYAGGTKQQ